MRIATEHELRGIVVWCPVLKKEISTTNYSLVNWCSLYDDDYGTDSSGIIIIFTCECGKVHRIGY